MVILQRGKAGNIPCANVEIRGASLCVYGKLPLDSMRFQPCPQIGVISKEVNSRIRSPKFIKCEIHRSFTEIAKAGETADTEEGP